MENQKKGLIIFARKPVLGKVKTRLAKGIGEEKALQIYITIAAHSCCSKTSTMRLLCIFN